ncbi:unnamed protein product [Allacma fusca]|uniref:Cytochrome P450 n=1 Tax=Allacma fusca TaxID=39272 RepID=A0A8J2L753_9HEXA|nr:unnamed protein product [Allacma fusca]
MESVIWPRVSKPVRTLVLNDVSSIQEAFRVNSLNCRPPIKFVKDSNENKGITMAIEASEQRQFIVQSMLKFALQTQSVEFYINNEITHIMKNLEEHSCHIMKIANVFDITTINGIWARIMTGHRLKSSDKILNLLENLSKHQRVQKRLHAEIVEVIGKSPPLLSDRSRLPHTEAVQHEVLRLCPTLPLGVGHYSLEESKFRNFLVPKGTMLISNIYGIHHNPKLWGEDGEVFRPKRFLSEDGTFQKSPHFLAFGAGKKSCPKKHWAKDLLFLYVTRTFQKFHIELDNDFLNYSEKTFGVMLRTKPFYVKITSYEFLGK